MKTFLTLALLSSIAATPAMAETFTRDGQSYEYDVRTIGNAQLIVGKNISTGEAFRLRVKGGAVSGNYAGSAIRFKTAAPMAAVSSGAAVFAAK